MAPKNRGPVSTRGSRNSLHRKRARYASGQAIPSRNPRLIIRRPLDPFRRPATVPVQPEHPVFPASTAVLLLTGEAATVRRTQLEKTSCLSARSSVCVDRRKKEDGKTA